MRPTTKVMIGRSGPPRIQVDTGDTVKVYSHDEWLKSPENPANKHEEKKEKAVAPKPEPKEAKAEPEVLEPTNEVDKLIEEDTEPEVSAPTAAIEEDAPEPTTPTKSFKGMKKGPRARAKK